VKLHSGTIGILIFGDNHLIVSGPEPPDSIARELVACWFVVRIGAAHPEHLREWSIVTSAFRENLRWAVQVGGGEPSDAVSQLLGELTRRGVHLRTLP
jgi:hypothetical protein